MSRRFWTEYDLTRLHALYPVMATKKLAEILGRSESSTFGVAYSRGLRKSEGYFESPESGRLRKGETRPESIATQFQKGQIPANKGLRRPGWSAGRMRETQFRKGERSGVAARNWKPVGTILPDPDGYLRIKVRDAVYGAEPTGFGNQQVWPFLQRYIWQQEKGPIPPGHVVAFKDGNRSNCTIENLECISRAVLAERNRMWNRYPRELAEAIYLNGQLKRKLRKFNGQKQDVGPTESSVRDLGSAEGHGQTDGPGAREDHQRGCADDHQLGKGRGRAGENNRRERRQRVLRRETGAASGGRRPQASGCDAEDLVRVVIEGLQAYRAFVGERIGEIRARLDRKNAARPLLRQMEA